MTVVCCGWSCIACKAVITSFRWKSARGICARLSTGACSGVCAGRAVAEESSQPCHHGEVPCREPWLEGLLQLIGHQLTMFLSRRAPRMRLVFHNLPKSAMVVLAIHSFGCDCLSTCDRKFHTMNSFLGTFDLDCPSPTNPSEQTACFFVLIQRFRSLSPISSILSFLAVLISK